MSWPWTSRADGGNLLTLLPEVNNLLNAKISQLESDATAEEEEEKSIGMDSVFASLAWPHTVFSNLLVQRVR
jgi:hypothetical protein